jgi:hypothetical protein
MEAATKGDKVRPNAVRALGYLVASDIASSPPRERRGTAARTSDEPYTTGRCTAGEEQNDEALRPMDDSAGQPPWLAPALRCLASAARTGNGKAQWNACYAIGNVLRRAPAANAAERCAMLRPLLLQLLDTLQHSANHKVPANSDWLTAGLTTAFHSSIC